MAVSEPGRPVGPGPAARRGLQARPPDPNNSRPQNSMEDKETSKGYLDILYTSQDGSIFNRFDGIRFLVQTESDRSLQVTYKMETFEKLSAAIESTTINHGFGPVDSQHLLLSVLGLRKSSSGLKIPGPFFTVDEAFGQTYDFKGRFMILDRKYVCSLLSLIFCTPRFTAEGVAVLSLDEQIRDRKYNPADGERYIECLYPTGPDVNDCISVIIKGNAKEPNTFTFAPSAIWECKRLEAKIETSEPSTVRIEADICMDTPTQ